MKIGIDARLINETGVGRYIRNLIACISRIDRTNRYVVFLGQPAYDAFTIPNERWSKVVSVPRWHTVTEQLVMPGIFAQEKLDVLHVPYHNPPLLYAGPMVITIHDLTILHFSTGKATTLPLPLYHLKRLGYVFELGVGLAKARNIIAVSQATKREIMDHFNVLPEKITVTYEGVDDAFAGEKGNTTLSRPMIPSPYFLYVGNAYPHKNLEFLISAYVRFAGAGAENKTKLVLVGNDDFFYNRLRRDVARLAVAEDIVFFGPANDSTLANLYTHATAFVFPSLMEGFGLPALEALSFRCPVIASNISVFHEILGKYATYVDPANVSAWADALTSFAHRRKKIPQDVTGYVRQYSWNTLARETISTYERCARV